MPSKIPFVQRLPRYFSRLSQRVFCKEELETLIIDFASAINEPLRDDASLYITYLVEQNIIIETKIEGEKRTIKRYLIGDPSPYEIGTSLQSHGYISHLSAAYIHGLIEKDSSLIYVSEEGSQRQKINSELCQENIDNAFKKPQRQSSAQMTWNEYKFLLLNSQYTSGTGLEKKRNYLVTTIERTLIDLTVRPKYGAGPNNVLNAYKKALPSLSIKNLVALLEKMEFTYPYHQSVGFYLACAGVKDTDKLNTLKKIGMPYTFYLDYEMNNPIYSSDWNLYFPQDLEI
jgi:hypothetical protein